ncbi:MAG: SAM-dependent methyltransferase [Candidatus Thorarchaeota archaeon]|nr:SAM-dependent methyltransferase [Candidatus Thorarchaeota archaeon]
MYQFQIECGSVVVKQNSSQNVEDIVESTSPIPFTARLIAYYRAQETNSESPLIIDPLAELLVGDLSSYVSKHRHTAGSRDYAIVRSYHIEKVILSNWCKNHVMSQIVLLGAGLDTRAYRFQPLCVNSHTVFEVDLSVVNQYKERILLDKQPLCSLIRVSTDLSNPEWPDHMLASGYSKDIPTIWILEGLVYYIEQDRVISLLSTAHQMSAEGSEIFLDVATHGLAKAKYGAFMKHFKWGLALEEAPAFFRSLGWHVDCSFADDYDQGRNVGQRALIFVHGHRGSILHDEEVVSESRIEADLTPQEFVRSFSRNHLSTIAKVSNTYAADTSRGYEAFLDFLKEIKPAIMKIVDDLSNPALVLRVAPRLQRVPQVLNSNVERKSSEEEKSFVSGVLYELLALLYCAIHGLRVWELQETPLYKEIEKSRVLGLHGIEPLTKLLLKELNKP